MSIKEEQGDLILEDGGNIKQMKEYKYLGIKLCRMEHLTQQTD